MIKGTLSFYITQSHPDYKTVKQQQELLNKDKENIEENIDEKENH